MNTTKRSTVTLTIKQTNKQKQQKKELQGTASAELRANGGRLISSKCVIVGEPVEPLENRMFRPSLIVFVINIA